MLVSVKREMSIEEVVYDCETHVLDAVNRKYDLMSDEEIELVEKFFERNPNDELTEEDIAECFRDGSVEDYIESHKRGKKEKLLFPYEYKWAYGD